MYNKVILIGNLGADPELRTLANNQKTTTISLATSESYTDKTTNEKKTETQWHRVVLWNKTAEIAEKYLKKGSRIQIEGKIKYRSWDDQDGLKHYATEIIGDRLLLLGDSKRESDQGSAAFDTSQSMAGAKASPAAYGEANDGFPMSGGTNGGFTPSGDADDLPF